MKIGQFALLMPVVGGQTDRLSYLASRVHQNDGNGERRCMFKVTIRE
jgi:hypothetical protein